MLISPISNINCNNTYKPSFKYWNREVFKDAGDKFSMELKHRNTTYMFRTELLWKDFIHFFREQFKNVPKVNVYDYGCSDGSEAYTFIMSLLSVADKKEAQKFFPIIAKDYDDYAIQFAKEGVLDITFDEIYKINNNTDVQFKEYFKLDENFKDDFRYNPNNILKDNVTFEVADLKKDYKNIKPDNSIVFARNFWPYFSEAEITELTSNLKNTLKKNSYIVIGKFDMTSSNVLRNLLKAGFKRTDVNYVYQA